MSHDISPTLEMVRALHPEVMRLVELPRGTRHWRFIEPGPKPAVPLDWNVDAGPDVPRVAIRDIELTTRYRSGSAIDVIGVVDGDVFYYAHLSH